MQAPLTIFTVPKPFAGHIGVIQRNAVGSWVRLVDEVILFEDEEGTADAASEFGTRHVTEVACTRFGTPLLNDVFSKAEQLCRTPWLVYANCDIIFREDFADAVSLLPDRPCLLTGGRWELDITVPIDFHVPNWAEVLGDQVRNAEIKPRGGWYDYFVFQPGTLGEIPPFAVGRPRWDHWLLGHALHRGAWVVDSSLSAIVIHQGHDYSHVPNGTGDLWEGPEADENQRIVGDQYRGYSLGNCATHRIKNGELVPCRPRPAL